MLKLKPLLWISALSLSLSLPLKAQETVTQTSKDGEWVTEVTITARLPGPALWRVKKGNSEVYILGAMPVMTKRLPWNSRRIERVIGFSNVLLTAPEASVGPVGLTRMQLNKRLPLGQKLDEVLPPDVSRRFYALVDAHGLDRDTYKTASPLWAVSALRQDVYDKVGIATRDPEKTLIRFAKAQNLKTKAVGRFSAAKAVAQVSRFTPAEDLRCVRATLDEIEFSTQNARAATEAWAIGDLKTVQRLSPDSALLACLEGASSTAALLDKTVSQTVTSINKALETPGKSVIVLPLSALLVKGGALQQLEAQGAMINMPEM